MQFTMRPESPYDLTRCVMVFIQFPSDGVDVWIPPREVLPASYRRLHIIEDEPVLAVVEKNFTGEEGELHVRSFPEKIKNPAQLEERVRWQFHLDAPLAEFYRRAKKHPLFKTFIQNLIGVKPLRPPTLYEMAVVAITEQQLAYPVAVKMRSRLVEALGRKMKVEGAEYQAFPTPQELARCRVKDLQALSFSTRKAEYLIDLSRKVADGFNIEELRSRSNGEVVSILTSIRGFGRWSAEYFLSRGLGRSDVFAADDLGLQTLVGKYLGPGRRVTAEEFREILKPWEPYTRWTVFYLFCAVRLGLIREGKKQA